MKLMLVASSVVLGLVACVSTQKGPDRELASIFEKRAENFADESSSRPFDQTALKTLVSSGNMKFNEARLILDNDASFDSKLELIRNAKKEIRMVYYIYSLDPSSALMSRELVKKAASGVKVKLLVDLITNFNNLDYFRWMEQESKGNLKVYFYNFPTPHIQSDAIYMSMPCPVLEKPSASACADHKNAMLAQNGWTQPTVFSRILLGGMYGKNPTALKVSFMIGAGIDPANYKDGASDEESQKQLFEFLKLVKDAYLKNDIVAKIKVAIAMATYGETLSPLMNEITGRLAFGNKSGDGLRRAQEWDHLTDYTHHKLLAVDGFAFQLGGRNIEDSYHVKYRVSGPGKYIFLDTDFMAKGAPNSTKDIENSFDQMLKVQGLVADMSQIERIIAVDYIMNSSALAEASQTCVVNKSRDMGSCIEKTISTMPSYVSTASRVKAVQAKVTEFSSAYLQQYKKEYRDS